LILLLAAAMVWSHPEHATADPVRAGIAVTNITPSVGYPQYRGASTGVLDSLHAKTVVFEQNGTLTAFVVCDLISIERELSVEVRSQAAERTGIPYTNIFVAGSHTHTGPSYHDHLEAYVQRSRNDELTAEDRSSYPAQLIEQIVQSVVEARENLQPVTLEDGIGEARGISFNRRFLMTDGTVEFNPGVENPDIVRPMSPIDPDVHIVLIRRANDGTAIASLSVFANHLDTTGGTEFSADYPYYLAESLKDEFGDDFISIFGTGPCGDINHIDVSSKPSPTTEEIGRTLAETVKNETPTLTAVDPALAVKTETVLTPLQQYTEEELAWARQDDPEPLYNERPFLQRRRQMKIIDLQEIRESGEAIPPTIGMKDWRLPLEVQVVRLGNETAVVALPGEVFVELGLAIKKASPFENTMIVELANTGPAYVPNREAFAEGAYEVINSRVAPGGGEMMVDAAVNMLNELGD
jgi:hypothetical protein